MISDRPAKHYLRPVVSQRFTIESLFSLSSIILQKIMTCIDLKSDGPILSHFGSIGGYARRQVGVLASDGVFSVASIRRVRPSVSWRLQNQNVSFQRATASHGLCSADLPGKPSRYRNLFARREHKREHKRDRSNIGVLGRLCQAVRGAASLTAIQVSLPFC